MSSQQTVVHFSKEYSEEDLQKLTAIVQRMVTSAEKHLESSNAKEGSMRTSYLCEPASAKNFSEAERVKCIVWDYTLTEDKTSAVIRYGACVFRKHDPCHTSDDSSSYDYTESVDSRTDNNDGREHMQSGENSKDTASRFSNTSKANKKGDIFNKKAIHATAMQRYNRWPVTFALPFKTIVKFRHTVNNVTFTDSKGTEIVRPRIVKEPYTLSREDQVFKAVRQMMCDRVNGGCSSRKRMNSEKKSHSKMCETSVKVAKPVSVTMVPKTMESKQ